MKQLSLFLFLFSMAFDSRSQLIFQKNFIAPGNQNAIAAMQSASDDYYILSETDSGQNNSKDFLLLKLDVSGNLIWSKYFGTTADDIPTDVKEMSNGKIMLCGYTYMNGVNNTDILLINIDTSGAIIWSKTFGGGQNDFGNKMVATSDSSVVIAGQTYSYGIINSSGYAVKVSSIGNILWSVTNSFNNSSDESFTSIDNTFDGGYILTGYLKVLANNYYNIPIIKIDAFGSVIDGVFIGVSNSSKAFGIKAIPGGDFIVTGKEVTNGSDTCSIRVLRANPSALSVSFVKAFTTSVSEVAGSVVVTPDGNFAFAGAQSYNNGFYTIEDGYLTKFDLTGNIIFNQGYKPPGYNSSLNTIIVTNDNNLLMTGNMKNVNGSSASIYLVKARLSDGLSGCNDSAFNYTSNSFNYVISIGANNNFGGIASSITITSSGAAVLQNDLCTNVGFEELTINNGSKLISPNPSNGIFKINFNNSNSVKTIQIFDVTGNIFYQKDKIKNTEQEMNLTAQPKGIYFAKVISGEETTINKIVIQ